MMGGMDTEVRSGRTDAVAWAILLAAMVVMGGQFAVGKLGFASGLTAYDIVALRFVGAAAVALPVVLHRGVRSLAGVGWGRGTALTAIAGAPYALLMYAALRFAPAAHGAMLVPGVGLIVATMIGAAWVGERHRPARYAGACVVLARRAIVDVPTLALALGTLGLLTRVRVPEPVVILAAAAVGLAVFAWRGP